MIFPRRNPFKSFKLGISFFLATALVIIWYCYVQIRITQRGNVDSDSYMFKEKGFLGEKYVHLDLKGAPPKISYYESLFPLLAELGATGLLIEYEDMFPYSGDLLRNIPAYNAYSMADIKTINLLAEKNNLSIVPLIQSFGHLEFLLKLKEFSYLREVQRYPQAICPVNNMTQTILFTMISQVIAAHPRSTMIHIGGDEVFQLGVCENCVKFMKSEKMSPNDLFLMHIGAVIKLIKKSYPYMCILMWDDKFRSMTQIELQDSTLSRMVEVVVWKYGVSITDDHGYNVFDTYVKVFPNIWVASAFKGATGSSKYLTTVSHHLENHISWMSTYHKFKNKISIRGIFITGWQRFDHFAVLCELLPVGIPSLVMSLSLLSGYNVTYLYSLPEKILKVLQCQNPEALLGFESGEPYCSYPGGEILDLILNFHKIKQQYGDLLEDSRVRGWLRSYNIDHNFSNPGHVYSILPKLSTIMAQSMYLQSRLSNALMNIYDNYTVTEWMETYYVPFFEEVSLKYDATSKLLAINHWPRRPLDVQSDL